MVQSITDHSEHPFEWIDIVDPDQDELNELTTKYALHESSINDWLQPDHLPKYEHVRSYTFIIFRMHAEKVSEEADTVPELTDKVAIFMFDKLVITLHKNEWLAP